MFNRIRRAFAPSAIAATALLLLAACANDAAPADGSNLSTSLQPVPLVEPASITVTLVGKFENFTPVLLADYLGEFEKENISVNFEVMPQTEAIPALAQGLTDVAFAGLSASYFNAVDGGAGLKIVLPGSSNGSADGLYVRTDLVDGAPESLKGKSIATSAGLSLLSIVPLSEYLATGGLTLDDVTIQTLPQADIASSVDMGVVDAGWLASPSHFALVENNSATNVTSYGRDQFSSAAVFGPNLLIGNLELGQAVIRALTRTQLTYLQGDYKSNPSTVASIAAALELTPEGVTKTASMNFGLVFDTALFTAAQEAWIARGDILTYSAVMEPNEYLDSSFVDRIDKN